MADIQSSMVGCSHASSQFVAGLLQDEWISGPFSGRWPVEPEHARLKLVRKLQFRGIRRGYRRRELYLKFQI